MIKLSNLQKKICISALIIFGVGLIVIGSLFVLPKTWIDYEKTTHAMNSTILKPFPVSTYPTNTDPLIIGASPLYSTHDVFAVNNPISYGIMLGVKSNDYLGKVFAFNDTTDLDPSQINNFTAYSYILGNPVNGSNNAIRLYQNQETVYNNTGTMTLSSEGKQRFILILFYKNGTYMRNIPLNPITVYPSTAKLLADNTIETHNQNIQSNYTNDLVEEFTLVIVGSIPIQFGIGIWSDVWKDQRYRSY